MFKVRITEITFPYRKIFKLRYEIIYSYVFIRLNHYAATENSSWQSCKFYLGTMQMPNRLFVHICKIALTTNRQNAIKKSTTHVKCADSRKSVSQDVNNGIKVDGLYLNWLNKEREMATDEEGDEKERSDEMRWDEIPGASWLDRCHPRDVKCHPQIYARLDFIFFSHLSYVYTRVNKWPMQFINIPTNCRKTYCF